MTDREELRRIKQMECDRKIAALHQKEPRLQQIADRIAEIALIKLKNAVRTKNPANLANQDREMQSLFSERLKILSQMGLDESVYEPEWYSPLSPEFG